MKTVLAASLLALILILAAACAGEVTPSGTPQPPLSRIATDIPLRFSLEGLASLAPGDVLLQQDYEPGLLRHEVYYPFGRVAPFTLFADGTLVYLHEGTSYDQQTMMRVQLPPGEAVALLQRVLDLGFGRLETSLDECRPTGEKTAEGESIVECVMDASITILRTRMPGGELREVKIYGESANDLQAFQAILGLLSDYASTQAQAYVPEKATLFVNPVESLIAHPSGDWPLDPQRLAGSAPDVQQVWVLEGEDLAAFLAAVPRNMGDFAFELDGRVVNTFLVPWLPGVDHTREILAEFPPQEPAQP